MQYFVATCSDSQIYLQRSVSRIELMYNACIGGRRS